MNYQNNIMKANERQATTMSAKTDVSTFDRSTTTKLDFDSGKLIPFYLDEVLPGDTIKLSPKMLVRQSTPIVQPMDDAKLTYAFFFVPNRLVVDWKAIAGENNDEWAQTDTVSIPQITFNLPKFAYDKYDSGSYLGVPPVVNMPKTGVTLNCIPFRAYTLIWNEFFRDENFEKAANIDNQGNPKSPIINVADYDLTNILASSQIGKGLLPVNNFPDYFQSLLPSPQKAIKSIIPFDLDVVSDGSNFRLWANNVSYPVKTEAGVNPPLNLLGTTTSDWALRYDSGIKIENTTPLSVESLRESIILQHYYELNARGGTRYIEYLQMHFGVSISDAEIQRPQLIGGSNEFLHVKQVLNQTKSETTPLGSVGGQGETFLDGDGNVDFSAKEHGVIIGVLCVRPIMTYSQGLPKFFQKKDILDFYDPAFDGLGEQPVYKSEIFLSGVAAENKQILGYNEAFPEYRYKNNDARGAFNGNVTSNLDPYSYVLKLKATPTLGKSFRNVDKSLIGSTLTYPNETQYFADIYVMNSTTRLMPMFSIGGVDKI